MERQALSDCSEEKYVSGPFWGGINASVSVLRNIKRACLPSIDKYDACLSKNKSNPLNCVDVLREVRPVYRNALTVVDDVC